MKKGLLFTFAALTLQINAQTPVNIKITNAAADSVLLGKYDPAAYKPSVIKNQHDVIAQGLINEISQDSLRSYIIKLASFYNRNTGSDTVSSERGIGAARRWVHSKFQEFSGASENRLLPGYLQFDQTICNIPQHRNIISVLPGLDTSDKSIIVIEGHIDSRCEGVCDTTCNAQGVEDNASGTALVMELARVMSKYAFNHTILFMATISEEQGLYGANAMAEYCKQKLIPVKLVQNNDVIGGIICGKTSSPPSCVPEDAVDSTHVRIFSYGGLSPTIHKNAARFIKLQYLEESLPLSSLTPMTINIMNPEDRTGRGGDHIPFRQKGFTAVRFTSSYEHGDANSSAAGYTDRQHSTRDTLGADTDNDGVVDSFFVSFSYL